MSKSKALEPVNVTLHNKKGFVNMIKTLLFDSTGVWTQDLGMLDKHFTTSHNLSAFFTLGYFQTGSHDFAGASLRLGSSYLWLLSS
jgi:hypothetical protein